MKITAIRAQVRNPDRVSIYVDEKYAFSLTPEQLLEQRIHSGLEIDEGRLAELKKISELGKAYARLLNYVMIRPRSRKELEDYSWRKKIAKEDAAMLINKLQTKGYVNDEKFARSWIESRILTKATSERKLRLELRQKGVSNDDIASGFAASDHSDGTALAHLVTKKRKLSRYQDDQKLLQYLVRQGFSFDDANRAIKGDGETDFVAEA